MAKLFFNYSTMNAGKSTALLQASHNYRERGMETYLLTAALDNRIGPARITSRIGLEQKADTYEPDSNLYEMIDKRRKATSLSCVFVDEAQFLAPKQVWELASVVDDLNIPVLCYGLRVDFLGNTFPGSASLLALADEMREVKTICHCGKKATMVVRLNADKEVEKDGKQIQIGGNEVYVSLCRQHWRAAIGR